MHEANEGRKKKFIEKMSGNSMHKHIQMDYKLENRKRYTQAEK